FAGRSVQTGAARRAYERLTAGLLPTETERRSEHRHVDDRAIRRGRTEWNRRSDAMDITQERKLVTEIPGPKSREWFERRANAVPRGVANIHPIVTLRASGAIVEDVDGTRLVDLATGISVLNVGHTAPEVVAAIKRQAA